MAKKTIPPKSEIEIKTPGYYLSIINATGSFYVDSPSFGRLIAVTGRKFDIHAREIITSVELVNETDQPIDVEFESSNIPVSGGSSAVSISNEVIVKEVKKGIKTETTVTGIEDGKVRQLTSNVFSPLPVVTIQPGESKIILPANPQTSRLITLQNVSVKYTDCWIGDENVVAEVGSFFGGSKLAPSAAEIRNEAAIYIFNAGSEEAKITVREEYRA